MPWHVMRERFEKTNRARPRLIASDAASGMDRRVRECRRANPVDRTALSAPRGRTSCASPLTTGSVDSRPRPGNCPAPCRPRHCPTPCGRGPSLPTRRQSPLRQDLSLTLNNRPAKILASPMNPMGGQAGIRFRCFELRILFAHHGIVLGHYFSLRVGQGIEVAESGFD